MRLQFWIFLAGFWIFGPSLSAQDAWAPLGLVSTNLHGVAVHYSPELETEIERLRPVLREVMDQTLNSRKRLAALKPKRNQLVAEMNRLLGLPPEHEAEKKQRMLSAMLPMADNPLRFDDPARPFALYVVLRQQVRAFVKEGGKLPGFTWDAQAGKALFNATVEEGAGEPAIYWLPIPVDAGAFDQALEEFRSVGRFGESPAGLMLHQVVTANIQGRLNPVDPFYRWFTDGFSKQLTYHLMQKFIGLEEARRFMAYFDVGRYKDLEKQLNLRFWPSVAYEIPIPLKSERRFRNARHAYSAFEMGRIVQLHGIECLAPILKKAEEQQPMRSSALFDAIKEVTGVDIAVRLKHYQTDPSMVKVVEGLQAEAKVAERSGDPERVLLNLLRISELNPKFESSVYFHAGRILHGMKQGEASDKVFTHGLKHLQGPHRDLVLRQYVDFLLKINEPQRALSYSAEALQKDPSHGPSLSVQMLHAIHQKRWFDAEGLAREILKHDPEATKTYAKNAEKVLAEIKRINNEIKEPPK